MQATQPVRRVPIRPITLLPALRSALFVAILVILALLFAGVAGSWHRSAAQPATAIPTVTSAGPTDPDALYAAGRPGAGYVDADARADARGELMP